MSHFRLIGDPHITRKFDFGVPLARKGERERLLFADFEARLNEGDERLLIMVGDLFEKPICNLQDLYTILNMILTAARQAPERHFVMMAGNHDISPQADTRGAFDILGLFDSFVPNLTIAITPMVIDGVAIFPWEWDRTAAEQLADVEGQDFDYAVGHWDLVLYDENHADHICPAKALTEMGAKEIYSGHWHVAGEYKIENVIVQCTGSMQPMTHAEDPDGKMYVTMTLEEYNETDPDTLKDKYVRVQIMKGEEVDDLPDCLGFKTLTLEAQMATDDAGPAEVSLDGFKVSDVVTRHLDEHGVPEDIAAEIRERLNGID